MQHKKMLPPTYLLIAIVVMVALHFLLPVIRFITLPWNVLGIVLLAVGIVINVMADNAFKRAETTVKPFEESAALITDGVFTISRHPMYLGFVLVLIGVALLLGSLTPFFVIPVFVALMEVVFIQVEERMLAKQYGQAWLAYKAKVRRWV